MYDVIIAGGGPAGLTAAIYAARAGMSTLVIEQMAAGGKVCETDRIENYPGFISINGVELAMQMEAHAKAAGAEITVGRVEDFELSGDVKKVKITGSGGQIYETKTVILALGAGWRKLNTEGEERLAGKGVSYCATCDGNFFKGRDVAVVGGGNVALEDALYLANICNKVYLIHRKEQLSGSDFLIEKVKAAANIELLANTIVEKIEGTEKVSGLALKNFKTGVQSSVALSGVFIAVGISPRTELLNGQLTLVDGYVAADETGATEIPGVFVAGDIRKKPLHQIVCAASDGANAATSAQSYIKKSKTRGNIAG